MEFATAQCKTEDDVIAAARTVGHRPFIYFATGWNLFR